MVRIIGDTVMLQEYASLLAAIFCCIVIWVLGINLFVSVVKEMNRARKLLTETIFFGILIMVVVLCILSTSIVLEFFGFA